MTDSIQENGPDKRIRIPIPVVVEGKYDKIRLSSVIDARIITTDGFAVFNNKEKRALIRRLSENGVILFTDSDGAGSMIRSYLKGCLAPDKVYELYTPRVFGREKRKKGAAKKGSVLGVEGTDNTVLRRIFADFAAAHCENVGKNESVISVKSANITKADMFASGLTGVDGSCERRDALCRRLELPEGMTPGALMDALNIILSGKEEFERLMGTM